MQANQTDFDAPPASVSEPGVALAFPQRLVSERSLGDALLRAGRITAEDLEKALQIQRVGGGRLLALLVRIGAVSEDGLLSQLAAELQVEYLQASDALPSPAHLYQFMQASPIKLDWFFDNAVLAWRQDAGLHLIARDFLDAHLFETLDYFYPDATPTFHLAANHQIDRLLDLVRREEAMERLFSGDGDAQLRQMAEEAPVIELVNNLLAQAVDANASDIHVEPGESAFSVRLRVDGVLHLRLTQPIERFAAVASRIKLISGIDIAERRLPQDGRISTRVSGQEMDIRVSTVPCAFGESVVLRLLPKEREELRLDKLGMASDHLELFRGWLTASNGIILVTGPTGSGKSTTLYAALAACDDGVRKIITVEDPVEYQMENITQIQTHAEIGYTFARALRAILRQDPDTIMIGEIRDLETAEIAIQSALTGHIVLSTVHTNDAISSFTRLIDMGVEPFLVASPIRGVQAQRLLRRPCRQCAKSASAPAWLQSALAALPASLLGDAWMTATGCSACQQTGYRGRIGIYEMTPMTDELQDRIVAGASLNDLKRLAASQGCRTLYEDGLIKASQGLTTLDEVNRLTLAQT